MSRSETCAALMARLPKAELAAVQIKDYPTLRLASTADITAAAKCLKEELGFDYLEMVTAVDWLGPVKAEGFLPARGPHPFTDKVPGLPVPPAAGPGISYRPVLDLLWSFGNLETNEKVFLRAETPRDKAQAPSLVSLFPAADWQEREVFDLLGVRFNGHPNLAKILTPDFLKGHPLRKDYVHQKDEYDE